MNSGVFSREATGGAVARGGFEYQDAFVLQNLPKWLAQDAFSHVVSETRGDVEVCYFSGSDVVLRSLYEAKGYELAASAFWSELADFKKIHHESPTEYVRFGLVCRSFVAAVEPLLNMLERLRGVLTSHPASSPVVRDARDQIATWMAGKGRGAIAEFVMDRVEFIEFADEAAEPAFAGEFDRMFSVLDLRATERTALKDQFKALIATSSQGPLHRDNLERAICFVSTAAKSTWITTPRRLQLASGGMEDLRVPLEAFDGTERANLGPGDWRALQERIATLAQFLSGSSDRRQISVDGKHRMSASCTLGYQLSAVRGFHLQVHHNGAVYRTDLHDAEPDEFFAAAQTAGELNGTEGVVCIGFPTPVGGDLNASGIPNLQKLARLDLVSSGVINGMPTLNAAVRQAKTAMVRFRSEHGLSTLHLVVKAPSVFAMILGYRLNGVGRIQLYDWADSTYKPTALLE
ncbi:MAG: dsDNA nuclease domain-containing protein [Pseudomonadota bacterium]